MYKFLKIPIVFFIILISSCEKQEETIVDIQKDDYYIKYNIKGNGVYRYFSNFSVITDQGKKTFSGYQYGSWNQTYGPVKKEFTASVTVQGDVTVDIYVSKNDGPFALKASKSASNSSSYNLSLSYKINF